jgi:hypothetical protein
LYERNIQRNEFGYQNTREHQMVESIKCTQSRNDLTRQDTPMLGVLPSQAFNGRDGTAGGINKEFSGDPRAEQEVIPDSGQRRFSTE